MLLLLELPQLRLHRLFVVRDDFGVLLAFAVETLLFGGECFPFSQQQRLEDSGIVG